MHVYIHNICHIFTQYIYVDFLNLKVFLKQLFNGEKCIKKIIRKNLIRTISCYLLSLSIKLSKFVRKLKKDNFHIFIDARGSRVTRSLIRFDKSSQRRYFPPRTQFSEGILVIIDVI